MSISTPTRSIDVLVPLYINHPSLYPIVGEFFESLKLYPDFNVITCDDCSPLPHDFPVTIKNDKNLGFTGTVNKLLSYSKADVMIVANDDLKFKPGDLDRYRELENGIYFPRDTASGDSVLFGSIWGMNRKTFNKIGLLDDKLKNFCSDREYYTRAVKLGIPVQCWNDICVEHRESATYKHEEKEKLLRSDWDIYERMLK